MGYHDVGIGVLLLYLPASISNTWSGFASLGFGEDIVNGHVRDLFLDNADVFLIGDHPHVFHGADGLEAVDGELDERTSHAHHVDELLGVVGGGHGPEAATDATSYNDDLVTSHYY